MPHWLADSGHGVVLLVEALWWFSWLEEKMSRCILILLVVLPSARLGEGTLLVMQVDELLWM